LDQREIERQTQQPGDASLLAKLRSGIHGMALGYLLLLAQNLPTIFLGQLHGGLVIRDDKDFFSAAHAPYGVNGVREHGLGQRKTLF